MKTIGKFSLKNQGGFVVKLQFVYWDADNQKHHKDGTDSFPLGQSQTADPGDYGVPDGSPVALYAFVVWGSDKEAAQMFTYQRGSSAIARYIITGTTLGNDLGLVGVD